ncbi:MAG: YciI family protein [Telluria sp.]
MRNLVVALLAGAALLTGAAQAQSITLPQTDAELAKALGGNDNGMRNYVMVLLRTGPKRMPDGPDRNKMFEGHFANIERLAKEKKMVLAGPLDGVDGLRGVFIFATDSIDEARQWVATDPVIANGEMVGEFHKFFASAAVMAIPQIHDRIRKK